MYVTDDGGEALFILSGCQGFDAGRSFHSFSDEVFLLRVPRRSLLSEHQAKHPQCIEVRCSSPWGYLVVARKKNVIAKVYRWIFGLERGKIDWFHDRRGVSREGLQALNFGLYSARDKRSRQNILIQSTRQISYFKVNKIKKYTVIL